MERFRVRFRIPISAYSKFVITQSYKRPFTIISVVIGISFLAIYFTEPDKASLNPMFLAGGFILIFIHAIMALLLIARVKKSPYFSEELIYEIGDDGISIVGKTFKGEYKWEHFILFREEAAFLILYQSKREVLFLMKTYLTYEQVRFIKSKNGPTAAW